MIWKNIKLKKGINFRSKEEFINFDEKIDIISIDKERSIIFLNNRMHFYNGFSVITPDDEDILKYDKEFYELIGKSSYDIIKEIFYICGLQIKVGTIKEKNKLDILIDKLKTHELYENIDKSEYWFLDLYPYIRSLSFYCKDRSRSLSVPKSYKENFGGRCTELLSIKKFLIDNLTIYQAIYMGQTFLGSIHLRDIMIENGIPPNPCMHDKKSKVQIDSKGKGQIDSKGLKDQKKLFDYD